MLRTIVRVWALVAAACAATISVCAAAPASSAETQPFGNPLWTIPLQSLTATRERPIFVPSRRPAMPAVPTAAVIAPPPPPPPAGPEQLGLRLLGTIAGRDSGIAICLNPATGDVVRVRTGESFEGWLLRTVHGREATFEKAALRTVLALPSPDDPQQPSAPQMAGALPFSVIPAGGPPQPAAATSSAPVSGTWRDGDGNLIAPPKR